MMRRLNSSSERLFPVWLFGAVLLVIGPNPIGRANDEAQSPCSIELLVNRELDAQTEAHLKGTSGWLARRNLARNLQKARPQLEASIKALCTSFENCTPNDVTAATSIALSNSISAISHSTFQRRIRQYGLLFAALASNTALQLLIGATFTDKTAALLSSNITTITTILVFSLGAPVLERLDNRVRQWALQNPSTNPMARNPKTVPFNERLWLFETTYWESQAHMGIPGTAGRSLNRGFVNEIRYPLSVAATMAQLDSEHGMEKAAALVAQLLYDLKAYPEFDPIQFAPYAHLWFGSHYVTNDNFETFLAETMAYAEVLEPGASTTPAIRDQYLSVFYSWFRPRRRTQILGE